MRRLTMALMLILSCLALAASPAFAQRDPFNPVIDADAGTATSTGTTTTGGGTTIVQPAVGSEGLANTGADLTPWFALAYTLIVVGGAALFLSRRAVPQPTRSS